MANEKETLILDLDNIAFLKKVLESKGQLISLGDSKNLEGLVAGLRGATVALGLVGGAVFAVKAAFDNTFHAEDIKAVNYQFETMAKNAGIAADVLKNDLVKAADGLVDDTDLLQATNKALIAMGSNAKDSARVFELARKATAGFGGDLLGNFQALNQAIATGQTRMLKQYGIVIDADKAYKEYAKSLGVTNKELSDQAKQQAILQAVLKQGGDKFKGINTDIKEAQNLWQQFKVTMGQIGETFSLVFDKILGPSVKNILRMMRDGAKDVEVFFKARFSEGAEKSAAQTEELERKLTRLTATIASLRKQDEDMHSTLNAGMIKDLERNRAALESQLKKKEPSQRDEQKDMRQAFGESPEVKQNSIDLEAQRKQRSQFEKDLLAMKKDRLNSEMDSATEVAEVERLQTERKLIAEQEHEQKIAELHRKRVDDNLINAQQEQAMLEQLKLDHQARMKAIDDQNEQEKIDAMQRDADRNKDSWDGFSKGAQVASAKALKESKDMSRAGAAAFQTLAKKGGDAFIAIGEGAESGGDAMKGFMFGALADIAEAEGRLMLAAALIDPARGAAGAGLLILAGVLRSQAKSAKSAGVGGGGEGGGGGEAGSSSMENKPDAEKLQKKAVNVAFNGPIYETDETKRRFMDMMREYSDATDFNYNKIPVGGF